MIAALPKIGVETPTFKPLMQFIKSTYGKEKFEAAEPWLFEICKARKKVLSAHRLDPQEAIILLKQYYKDFEVLSSKIKFTEPEKKQKKGWFSDKKPSCSVRFIWCDAYFNQAKAASYFPGLEKGAVLFNIAAFYSSAALQTDESAQGLKDAVKYFRISAGTFTHLSQSSEVMDSSFTQDLSRESCEFLAILMIAQAQATYFQMAATRNMSAGLIAKLGQGAAFLFMKAFQTLSRANNLSAWMRKSKYDFAAHARYQELCFKAAAQFWQAQVEQAADEYGNEIGRLRLASIWLAEAGKMSPKVAPSLEESRHKLYKLTNERLGEAEKDNNEVYHYKVAKSLNDLAVIQEKVVCKELEFSLADVEPMKNPFQGWVPEIVAKANKGIKTSLHKRKTQLGAQVNEQNDMARALMASLGLPAKLDSIESGNKGLPDVVWGRIQEFQSAGGMNRVGQLSKQVIDEAQKASSAYKEIIQRLNQEEKEDSQLRKQYGKKWGCLPSQKITKNYRDEAATIGKFMNDAEKGNKTLLTELKENEMQFLRLCAPRHELASDIPAPKGLQDPEVVVARDLLAKALTQLSYLINEREAAYKKYAQQVDQTDLTAAMMSGTVSVKQASDQVIEEFKASEGSIIDNIKTQKFAINEVQKADDAFNKSRNVSKAEEVREAKIHDLNETVTKYNKLCKNFEDGITFYTDLKTVYLKPLQDAVGDFLTARVTERAMLIEDLNKAAKSAAAVTAKPRVANAVPNNQMPASYGAPVQHQYTGTQQGMPGPQQGMPYGYQQPAFRQGMHQQAYPPPQAYAQPPNYGQVYQNPAYGQNATAPPPNYQQAAIYSAQQPPNYQNAMYQQRGYFPPQNYNQAMNYQQPNSTPQTAAVAANTNVAAKPAARPAQKPASAVPPTAPTVSYQDEKKDEKKSGDGSYNVTV